MVISENTKVYAVIVAAGSGSRYGGSLPKQFLELDGKPVLCHSIDAFRRAVPQSEIILVLSPAGKEIWHEYCQTAGYESPRIVSGGASRSESVSNAISSIDNGEDAIVMIHDGARPLLSSKLISRLLEAAVQGYGAVPALPLTDSIVSLDEDSSISTASREAFRRVQTPQVFPLHTLKEVYSLKNVLFTDDLSAVLTHTSLPVSLVPGDEKNIKITTPGDLALAVFLKKESRPY